jgi:hypothetical protein
VLLPLQIVVEAGEMVMVGREVTVTVAMALTLQPAVVPTTVYAVVVVGDTVMAAVVAPPGVQA